MNGSDFAYDVFISYSSKDKAWVRGELLTRWVDWSISPAQLRAIVVPYRDGTAAAFEGFARQQLDRVLGLRGKGKHGQRPELEEKFGYDTKAAMHVIRLLKEGIEYMHHGQITYPRFEKAAGLPSLENRP